MPRLTTPFGFSSTAAEVAAGLDLTGRRIVVTGGGSGLGAETARVLAGAGADVTLAVRDLAGGHRTAAALRTVPRSGSVRVAELDLSDQASVARFVAGWDGPLDVLVANAGVLATPQLRTVEGWDLQLATNHLGHFALALGLRGALARDGGGRIVSVSSSVHMRSPVIFDDLHFDFRPYDPWAAYSQSKTANILFAVGAQARWARDGITANALMPGAIETRLQRHVGTMNTPAHLRKTVQQGAATSVLLAASPLVEGVGGRYFADCNEAEPVTCRPADHSGVAPYALDPDNADRLWERSVRMLRPTVPRQGRRRPVAPVLARSGH